VRTPETVCHEIFREIVRQSRQFQSKELLILAHQNVIDRLLDDESAVLAELEHQVGGRYGYRWKRSTASTNTTWCWPEE
jgi:ribonuclease G